MAKPKFGDSFGRAVETFVGSMMFVSVVGALKQLEGFPGYIIDLVIIGSIFGTVLMIRDMQYWNHEYTLGWVLGIPFGISIMIKSGLLSLTDILLYSGVTVAGVYLKYVVSGNSQKYVSRY